MEGHLSANSLIDVEGSQLLDPRLVGSFLKSSSLIGIESVNTLEYAPNKPLSILDDEIIIEIIES